MTTTAARSAQAYNGVWRAQNRQHTRQAMPSVRIVAIIISGIIYLGFIANLQQVGDLNRGIPLDLQTSTSNPIQYVRELITLLLAVILARGAFRTANRGRVSGRIGQRSSTGLVLFFVFLGIPTAEALFGGAVPPQGVLIGLRFVYILVIALSLSKYTVDDKTTLVLILARSACLLIVIEAAIAAYQITSSPPTLGITFLGSRPWGTYSSSNNLGLAFLGAAIVLAISNMRLRRLWLLACVAGCVATGSRAAIIGVFLVVVGISVRRMRFRLAFLPGLMLALYGVYSTASSQEVSGRQIHGEKRFQTWADALSTSHNLFQKIFGQGIGVGTNGVTTRYGLQNITGPGISDSTISAGIIATGLVGITFYIYAFIRAARTISYDRRTIIVPALLVAAVSFNVPELSPFNILMSVVIGCSIIPERVISPVDSPQSLTEAKTRSGGARIARAKQKSTFAEVQFSDARPHPQVDLFPHAVVDALSVGPDASEITPPGSVRAATRAGVSRGLALAIGLVLTSVTTRIAISDLGLSAFGVLALIAAIVTLLPFADLGLGAAIMSTLGAARTRDDVAAARQVVSRSLKLLYVSAAVLLLVDGAMYALGLWPRVLGGSASDTHGLSIAATAAFGLIAVTVPFGIGNRIFIGLHKTDRVPLFSLITYLVTLLITIFAHLIGAEFWVFVLAWPAGALASALATTYFGLRAMGYSLSGAIHDSFTTTDLGGVSVGSYARPMFILSVAAPIALQTDRLVLSHVSSRGDLAAYALVAQLYGPLYSLVQTAGTALWPIFARYRSERRGASIWIRSMIAFASVGLVLGGFLVLVGPLYAKVVARSDSVASHRLYVVFALLLVVQATFSAASARFTSPDGLKLQAKLAVLGTLTNFVVSIFLAARFGAVGPVAASAACILLFQVSPLILVGRRNSSV